MYKRYTRVPPRNEAEQLAVEERKKDLDEIAAVLQHWLEVVRLALFGKALFSFFCSSREFPVAAKLMNFSR